MFDSIDNVNDFLSEHWLAEVFPTRLKDLTARWRDNAEHGKPVPMRELATIATPYLAALAALAELPLPDEEANAETVTALPSPEAEAYAEAVTELHRPLVAALGFEPAPSELQTAQGESLVTVPLLARVQGPAGDALHVLQARPVDALDDLFGADAQLVQAVQIHRTSEKVDLVVSPARAVQQLFLTDDAPRYLLVLAGSWLLLTDVGRWAEGRYLAFDLRTALSRRDDKATGELAWHAGLYSADVLLPGDGGKPVLDDFTQDSERHAIGVSADLREGLRTSIELIAGEVLDQRRRAGQQIEGIDELPSELTSESLRFLYRVLFLLYAEARPELGILPVGVPEYGAGYGLDRLRDLIQVPLTGTSQAGHHLHDSLKVLFRLVNDGHGHAPATVEEAATHEGLVFEALRADLFDPGCTPHIDSIQLSNAVLQQVLQLLLLSKPSSRKGSQRGYISYAQLGINQLGAVYEGLMSYSGIIATEEMVELAKDGNADKGSWLVPSTRAGDYGEDDLVWREDRLTGAKAPVRHPKGSFVFRLSGRERQRSASYYTPEIFTRTVVKHALDELITDQTSALDILEYRVCEPALGSGAFLNEAINQLAKAYLDRRQLELDQRIEPEHYAIEEQKVKAYLALHRAYGVDLNATAVELAEVSLWLNVMHPRLQAPWFGLHLCRGNSLIGARRATYDLTALGAAKQSWLSTSPTDRPLSDGPIGDGEIHHFLLPADGWGAVARAKQAKERAPVQASVLREWQRAVTRKPKPKEVTRLKALARRVERLWALTLRRLEISEREIARNVNLWGADLAPVHSAVTRAQVESALDEPGSPYRRLRWVMDAWCALSFWPLDGAEPPTLAQWLDGLEAVLGLDIGKPGRGGGDDRLGLFGDSMNFADLADADHSETSLFEMKPELSILDEYPWLGQVRVIAEHEGFFHWELDFAQVFNRGGFDLQVGNPPWVRPIWKDDIALSEHDPFFSLQEKIPDKVFGTRRAAVLDSAIAERQYLADLTSWAGTAEHLGSPVEHPVLAGVQTNLYTNFMERTWRSAGGQGVVGLLHPEGHFTDPKAGSLRRATYVRLRLHVQFINELMLFEEIGHPVTFGIHIYSRPGPIGFRQVASVLTPETSSASFVHDGSGEVPGIQFAWGGWDLRPHASRVTTVTESTLTEWAALFDPPGTPGAEARLVRPLTREHLDVLATISRQIVRIADIGYESASGWHEKGAKKEGYIQWRTEFPESWSESIWQGPHFTVANPFAKEPNEFCRSKGDYSTWDLEELPERVLPRTNYQRACASDRYDAGLEHWDGEPFTRFWRMAWRKMTQPGLERSLHAALLLPGPALTGNAQCLGMDNRERHLAIVSGLCSSLPYDYLIKVSGKANIYDEQIARFPAPLEHPAAPFLLLRTLRLNCLTRDYAPLWEELHEAGFAADAWTTSFADWPSLGVTSRNWTMDTPLRSDYERRAALVEIDALAALMLGLTADHLALIFRAQFPVLRKYEYGMYFDNAGRKIAMDHQTHGVNQNKDDFSLLQAYLRGESCGDLLDRYDPHPDGETDPALGFIRPDRESEMRAAYAEFAQRLRL